MDKIERESSSSSGAAIEKCNVRCLLFADDIALLSSKKVIFNMHLIGFLIHAWVLEYKSVRLKLRLHVCQEALFSVLF